MMTRRAGIRAAIALLIMTGTAVFSQGAYQIELKAAPDTLSPGRSGSLNVTLRLTEGYHVSAPDNGLFSVETETVKDIVFGKPAYPKGVKEKFGVVYRGTVQVQIPFTVQPEAVTGIHALAAKVTIQQCGESQGVCFPPEDVRVETRILVDQVNKGKTLTTAESGGKDIAGRVADALEKGSFTALLLVFLGGLLTSFTPCVYPMIPITVAVIGAQASGKKLSGLVLSLFYVFGIGVTFSALGMVAAKTGSLFGSAMNHPVFKILIAAVFLLMGLSMLGAFVMQMPPSLAARLRGKKRKGFLGAFFTGTVAGLVVSPCISPLLVVILTWVAKKGSLLLGFGLLFSFAMGLGVLFVVIGTFSGALRALPKSGLWMELIERGFGILLVTMAVVFMKPVLSPFIYACLWAVSLVFGGTFLGAFTPLDKESDGKRKITKAAAVLMVMFAGILLFQAYTGGSTRTDSIKAFQEDSASGEGTPWITSSAEGIPWISSETKAFQIAGAAGKYVLMDFFAEWCAACRELDEKTWPDVTVQKAAAGFFPLKMDLTEKNDRNSDIQKKYKILGMPTVIITDSKGNEIDRFTGYKSPKEVAEFLSKHAR
jgi:thioredoxin:protein disulfide reductase